MSCRCLGSSVIRKARAVSVKVEKAGFAVNISSWNAVSLPKSLVKIHVERRWSNLSKIAILHSLPWMWRVWDALVKHSILLCPHMARAASCRWWKGPEGGQYRPEIPQTEPWVVYGWYVKREPLVIGLSYLIRWEHHVKMERVNWQCMPANQSICRRPHL